jgi:hypothetical protein
VFWIVVTLALIIMRVDEKRVSRGQATFWRTMQGKGPKDENDEIAAFDGSDDGAETSINKANLTGAAREIRNLTV